MAKKQTALVSRTSITTALVAKKLEVDEVRQFVRETLKEGIDWGLPDPAASKPSLWKSGAEKVRRSLGCRSFAFVDKDVVESISEPGDTVYLHVYWVPEVKVPWIPKLMAGEAGAELSMEQACSLLAVTDGRGAADPREGVVRTRNVAVKKAEIRAEKDAALRLGLSDIFTQDVGEAEGSPDDEPQDDGSGAPPREPARAAPPPAKPKDPGIFDKARDVIMAKTSGAAQKAFLASLEKATRSGNTDAARAMIDSLNRLKKGATK